MIGFMYNETPVFLSFLSEELDGEVNMRKFYNTNTQEGSQELYSDI
jgi:hypothetical protein